MSRTQRLTSGLGATVPASGSGALLMLVGRKRLVTHDQPPCTDASSSCPGIEWSSTPTSTVAGESGTSGVASGGVTAAGASGASDFASVGITILSAASTEWADGRIWRGRSVYSPNLTLGPQDQASLQSQHQSTGRPVVSCPRQPPRYGDLVPGPSSSSSPMGSVLMTRGEPQTKAGYEPF